MDRAEYLKRLNKKYAEIVIKGHEKKRNIKTIKSNNDKVLKFLGADGKLKYLAIGDRYSFDCNIFV